MLCWSLILLASMAMNRQAYAGLAEDLHSCAVTGDDGQRLRCYDNVARGAAAIQSAPPAIGREPESCRNPDETDSYLSRLWELDTAKPRGRYTILPHRTNYIMPLNYNKTPSRNLTGDLKDAENIKETEVAFQLSIKGKLWQDVLGRDMDLWFAYTQRSFWQFYDFADSSPFRDTNYEPEILLNLRTDYTLFGFQNRMINIGLNHQSNGRAEPYSRSWNRAVINFGFEKAQYTILLKTWYRYPEDEQDDDNPDLYSFMGPGELWCYYQGENHRFGMMVRNNFDSSANRGGLLLEWSYPLIQHVGFYIQAFTGYGESLIDYNNSMNRIGIGITLTDWQ